MLLISHPLLLCRSLHVSYGQTSSIESWDWSAQTDMPNATTNGVIRRSPFVLRVAHQPMRRSARPFRGFTTKLPQAR